MLPLAPGASGSVTVSPPFLKTAATSSPTACATGGGRSCSQSGSGEETVQPKCHARRHRRAVRGNSQSDSVKCLLQECAISKEGDVLLGAVISAYPADQGSQPHALAPCENDTPELALGR